MGRVPSGEDHLLAKPKLSLVQEQLNRFMLLAEQDGEIHQTIAVKVGDRHVDRPVPGIDLVRFEESPDTFGRAILQHQNLTGLPPAEHCHHQIEIAVLVEIGGFYVRHPSDSLQQNMRFVRSRCLATQPDDTPLGMILR